MIPRRAKSQASHRVGQLVLGASGAAGCCALAATVAVSPSAKSGTYRWIIATSQDCAEG
jgi:hypothetical protein